MNQPTIRQLRALVTHDTAPALPRDVECVAAAARAHRLAPVIVDRWAGDESDAGRLAEMLHNDAIALAGRDMRQTTALAEIADAAPGRFLALKGSAFGPLLYGRSELRPRLDVDVWFGTREDALEAARRLQSDGWEKAHQLPGRYVPHAIALHRGHGAARVWADVHLRCSRRHRVAAALPFTHVWDRSIAFAVGGTTLRAPGFADAWLHAALHLEAHHGAQRLPLIMFEDLRRLSERLTETDWSDIWDRACEHGLVSALSRVTMRAAGWGGEPPRPFVEAVRDARPDESARFDTAVGGILDDLDVLDADGAVEYLSELVFPPAEYLSEHYGLSKPRPVALLWTHRAVTGLWRARTTLSRRSSTDAV